MRREFLDILACPLCKSALTVAVVESKDEHIMTGTLTCSRCSQEYPIDDGIPNLLPPGDDGSE